VSNVPVPVPLSPLRGAAALSALAAVLALAAPRARAAEPAGASPRRQKPMLVDRVVAVVNDVVILHSDLMQRVAPLTAELEQLGDPRERKRREQRLRQQQLEELVNEQLMVQAAEEAKLEVSDKEVQNALEEIKRQNKLSDAQLEEALRLQGYTLSAYRSDMRRQLLRMRAINMLVRPRVTVTDDDVRAHYDASNRRAAAVSSVHLQHILIALPEQPSEQLLSAAKARAADLIQRARNGESFADLARQNSDDAASAAEGGDLGWIERGSIATEWEAVVFAMEKGEVRGPINGPRGLHVFHVSELKRNEAKPFDEVKEQVRAELYRRELDRQTRLWLEELRRKAHVEIRLSE
jgi:parvulin-like peptidyl-prolyl isomerase